jgi:hypothetical protein
MTEHDPKAEERVEDLDVPESESDEVKGGLLPAVHSVREAANDPLQKLQVAKKIQPGGLGSFGDGSV